MAVVKRVFLFVMTACMGASAVAQGESALNPTCYKLYEMFNLPNLSYEDVGKIADQMHENKCWPVLQGIEVSEARAEQSLPTITDCASLATHIVQMTRDQTNQTNPGIVRIYGVKALDASTCGKSFFKDNEGRLNFLGRYMPEENFYTACGPLMGASTEGLFRSVPGGPTKILNCMGTVRYAFGHDQDEPRYFYLERFPDGEEFFGVSPPMQ